MKLGRAQPGISEQDPAQIAAGEVEPGQVGIGKVRALPLELSCAMIISPISAWVSAESSTEIVTEVSMLL